MNAMVIQDLAGDMIELYRRLPAESVMQVQEESLA
jgi:PTS system cellobiose-specific IIA component